MAKVSSVERNKKRIKLCKKFAKKRQELKKVIYNKNTSSQERFECQLKLAALPKNSSKVRQRNRCALTGRPRGYYRKLGVSRIMLRELASFGDIPGMKKSSW
ncbi:MAG: 30S ribosomal protein S14 [Pseudomonadota bacterium]